MNTFSSDCIVSGRRAMVTEIFLGPPCTLLLIPLFEVNHKAKSLLFEIGFYKMASYRIFIADINETG